MQRTELVEKARRIVIKLGTAVLINDEGGIALSRFYSFVESIAKLKKSGREVLLVTSGAIGLGAQKLGPEKSPKLLAGKRACAAIGQGRLMALYSDAFERLGMTTAQVLLTEDDFSNRQKYLNLRSTLSELLHLGVIPIINENDTVSAAGLDSQNNDALKKVNFGDNDKLSALVASKIEADLLLILTDVQGLYNGDPRSNDTAKLIPVVEHITPDIEALGENKPASGATNVGRGGIGTKLAAARIATQSGCAAIIAGGKNTEVITRIFDGDELGTLFLPEAGLRGKQRWIAFATTIKAAVVVNEGAREALVKRKASLLSAGVIEVRENFDRGDVVSILDANGHEFARGIANYSSIEAKKISGRHSAAIDDVITDRNYDALITRDNIAFLAVE
jgi:glutamate 5-kinase